MPTFTITKFDMCSMKFIGIGWRNILFLEYDMVNPDLTIDTTPEDIWTNNRYVNAIDTYIEQNGVAMEHALQSIPWMVRTAGKNKGDDIISMPGIPWQFYENGVSTLDEFEMTIETTNAANAENPAAPVDMAFSCEYDPDIEDPDGDERGRGLDLVEMWGDNHGLGVRIPPYIHHNWYTSGVTSELKPVIFYGGNYSEGYEQNVKWPYMYPILAIQGTRKNPISITLIGWAFDKPYYNKGIANNIAPGYNNNNNSLYNIRFWQYNSERQFILEHWLKNLDADSSLEFLQNKLFIRFGEWQEDIDPYDGWGDQDEDNPSGGDGDGYLDDDDIPADVPNVSVFALNTFFSAYRVTAGQLADFASFCWSTDFDATVKKFYTSPSQAILGLMFVPYTPIASGGHSIYLGSVNSEVSAARITHQFQKKDCGKIYLPEATKSYLDYDPYLKLQIYLPFCGVKQLSADDCVGKNIGVVYCLDTLSGGLVAHVTVNGTIMYSFSGNCAIQVPVTAENLGQAALSAATAAAGAGAVVATGGAAAAPAAGAMAVSSYGMTNAASAMSAGSGVAASLKSNISHGGAMSSSGGWLGPGKPHLIVSYPNIVKAHNQKEWSGYPTYRGYTVGGFSGYTQFEAVKLKATKATMEEQQEILELLKGGVFL